mgnify:CR=1 FL=1
MEKENYSQLELFSQSKGPGDPKIRLSSHLFSFIRNYEKGILFFICFIITAIVSFSLGVEKGKKVIKVNPPHPLIRTEKGQSQPVTEKQEGKQLPKVKEYIENYTIQVATYQAKTHAQKEAEALRKKGFLPLILSKSGYTVLCVGNFSNKETAKSSLSELKKRYQDCFIRRL